MSRLLLLLLAVSCLAPQMVLAQAARVDDSASQVLGHTLKLRWDDPVPRNDSVRTMSGTITVHVRLDVRPWAGQQVRIYKKLGTSPGARVLVRWTSQGRLMPGQLRQGERSLVYAGPITSGELQDVLQLSVIADGSRLQEGREILDFDFELETLAP